MAYLPSLKQLTYLVALAKELNFTRAAETCFVGQSTLSAGLKELEDGLGIPSSAASDVYKRQGRGALFT